MEWQGRETKSMSKLCGTLENISAVEKLNQRKEVSVCVWGCGGSWGGCSGEAWPLSQVLKELWGWVKWMSRGRVFQPEGTVRPGGGNVPAVCGSPKAGRTGVEWVMGEQWVKRGRAVEGFWCEEAAWILTWWPVWCFGFGFCCEWDGKLLQSLIREVTCNRISLAAVLRIGWKGARAVLCQELTVT